MQISIYLKLDNILYSGQHGFRNGHSRETALHELISYLNENRDKRAILIIDNRDNSVIILFLAWIGKKLGQNNLK